MPASVLWVGTDMATITAATASSETAERPPAARHLWQAPVFVAGVAALLAAWLSRPAAGLDPARRLEQHLAGARHQLARPDGNVEEAVELTLHALEEAEQFPERMGEAHFLLGTAYLRLGDRAARTAPGLAEEHWRVAHDNLDKAEHLGVPPEEWGRLQYRLGKVGFFLKDKPERVAERLAAGVDQAEDRAEACSLLTRAYLALNPPNLKEALRANERLRQEVPRVDEQVLAPAKLLGGELLLRMGKPEQARKVLEKIGEQAPAEVLTQARLLRARTYQDEGKWKEAAELWKAVLEDKRAAPPEVGRILYNLGVCHRGLDEPREAAGMWEECLRKGRGDEVSAAALALAELRLHDGDKGPDQAPELFQRAVENVRTPEEWKNSLVDLSRARETFERAVQACRQMGRFDLAVALTGIYDRLALSGRGPSLRAEVYGEWAQAYAEQAAAAKDGLARQKGENAAREMLRQAGTAHAEAAERGTVPAEQAQHLWQSAGNYLQGEDYARAAAVLERFLERYPRSEHQGEGWFRLAEAYRHLNNQQAAHSAYAKCIEFPTPFAYRARYHLALAAIEKNEIDKAEEILLQNLQLLRYDPDQEAHEKSLFTLGDLMYRRKNYRKVVQHLGEAVGRFPSNPEATRAHFELADSYRRLASQEHQAALIKEPISEETRRHFLEEHQQWLEKAAAEFDDLANDLEKDKEGHRGHLSPEEEIEIPYIAAECYLTAGKYDKALQRYLLLAQRYHGQGYLEVRALEGAARVYAHRKQFDLMQQRLNDIRAALPSLPEKYRAAWEKWVQDASRVPTVSNDASPASGGR